MRKGFVLKVLCRPASSSSESAIVAVRALTACFFSLSLSLKSPLDFSLSPLFFTPFDQTFPHSFARQTVCVAFFFLFLCLFVVVATRFSRFSLVAAKSFLLLGKNLGHCLNCARELSMFVRAHSHTHTQLRRRQFVLLCIFAPFSVHFMCVCSHR